MSASRNYAIYNTGAVPQLTKVCVTPQKRLHVLDNIRLCVCSKMKEVSINIENVINECCLICSTVL